MKALDYDSCVDAVEWCCDEESSQVLLDEMDMVILSLHIRVNREAAVNLGYAALDADAIKAGFTWYRHCYCEHDCCGHVFRSDCKGVISIDDGVNYIVVVVRYRNY